jgi:hypothetical protein
MKNTQKGFIVPLLIVIIVLLGIGGVYVYKNKKEAVAVNNNLKTFTHSTGAFSFAYPKELTVTENNNAVTISQGTDLKPIMGIGLSVSSELTLASIKPTLKTTTSNGYKVYTFQQFGIDLYLIPLEDSDNTPYLVISILPNTAGFGYNDLEPILNSLSIDKTNVQKLVDVINQSLNASKDKGVDAMIKANLSNMRAEAAFYYDNNGSYSGFCTNDKTFVATGENIKKATGFSISCFASKTMWSASVSLKNATDTAYCVDDSGFAGAVSSPTIGLTGKCK